MKFVYAETMISNDCFLIKNSSFRHLYLVLRKKIGDFINVNYFNKLFLARIIKINKIKKEIAAKKIKCIKKKREINSCKIKLTLIIGVLKNRAMNLLLKQLNEIGINLLIPFFSDNSVLRILDKERKNKKFLRWKNIIKESSKQCNTLNSLQMTEFIEKKEEIINKYISDLNFIFHETAENFFLKKFFDFKKNIKSDVFSVTVLIGPEGGFTKEETNFFMNKFSLVSLGNRILRSETAALYVSAVLKSLGYNFYKYKRIKK